MTREEVIRLIDERMCFGRGKWSKHHMPVKDIYWQAGEMAIKALKHPEIIRCEDCAKCQIDDVYHDYWCDGKKVWKDHFCGYAERRTDEHTVSE